MVGFGYQHGGAHRPHRQPNRWSARSRPWVPEAEVVTSLERRLERQPLLTRNLDHLPSRARSPALPPTAAKPEGTPRLRQRRMWPLDSPGWSTGASNPVPPRPPPWPTSSTTDSGLKTPAPTRDCRWTGHSGFQQPADAAAEREARHAGVRDQSRRAPRARRPASRESTSRQVAPPRDACAAPLPGSTFTLRISEEIGSSRRPSQTAWAR